MFRSLVLAAALAGALALPASAEADSRFAEIDRRAAELKNLTAVIVAKDGEILYQRGPVDTPTNIKSASKAIVTALVGIAIDKGVLQGAGQKISTVLSGSFPNEPDPRLNDITLEDLMTMRAGLERTSGANYGRWISSRDWVRDALARPFVDEPGGRMLYSTGNTHLLSAVLTSASRKSTLELANEWLGEPLGFRIASWDRDRQGIYLGGNNMSVSPRSLLKFGELYRNRGTVNGVRVLPETWIDASWTPVTESFFTGHGYGYGWFSTDLAGQRVNYAWGHGGQMLYVVPGANLTVVMTSNTDGYERGSGYVQKLHALLGEVIIPAAMEGQIPSQ
jgi:CubicO group peptidase (beta-lactamase class C family)